MSTQNRNILIVVILLTGLVLYMWTTLIYKPNHAAIQQSELTNKDLQTKLAAAKARAQQLSQVQQEMASLQVEVAELEKQLPKNRELPSLIRTFTHRAETYGLTIASFAPGRAVSKGGYDEIPYIISTSASFHSLGKFLTAMGKGDRLFGVRNLSMVVAGNRTNPSKTINANFTLIAFKYHE